MVSSRRNIGRDRPAIISNKRVVVTPTNTKGKKTGGKISSVTERFRQAEQNRVAASTKQSHLPKNTDLSANNRIGTISKRNNNTVRSLGLGVKNGGIKKRRGDGVRITSANKGSASRKSDGNTPAIRNAAKMLLSASRKDLGGARGGRGGRVGHGGHGGRGGRGGRSKSNSSQVITKDSLDKELDSYMMRDPKTASAKLDEDLDDYMEGIDTAL